METAAGGQAVDPILLGDAEVYLGCQCCACVAAWLAAAPGAPAAPVRPGHPGRDPAPS